MHTVGGPTPASMGSRNITASHTHVINCFLKKTLERDDVAQCEFTRLENARVSSPTILGMCQFTREYKCAEGIQITTSLVFCSYTGYVRGLRETFGNTVVPAQHRAASPAPGDFLHTRSYVPAAPAPERDSCNFPDEYKPSASCPNLWPSMQSTGTHIPGALCLSSLSPAGMPHGVCCPLCTSGLQGCKRTLKARTWCGAWNMDGAGLSCAGTGVQGGSPQQSRRAATWCWEMTGCAPSPLPMQQTSTRPSRGRASCSRPCVARRPGSPRSCRASTRLSCSALASEFNTPLHSCLSITTLIALMDLTVTVVPAQAAQGPPQACRHLQVPPTACTASLRSQRWHLRPEGHAGSA